MVLLAREFGWTIEEMRDLRPSELAAILKELQRQIALKHLNEQRNHWAFLAAVITNNFSRIVGMFSKRKPKAVNPDEYLGEKAKRLLKQLTGQDKPEEKDWSKHIEDAKAKGLAVPEE